MLKQMPERTCVACRKKSNKQDFLKVVKNGEEVQIDETGKLDGRGAYVCKNEICIRKAIKTRAFNRSFKCNINEDFYKNLENYLQNL